MKFKYGAFLVLFSSFIASADIGFKDSQFAIMTPFAVKHVEGKPDEDVFTFILQDNAMTDASEPLTLNQVPITRKALEEDIRTEPTLSQQVRDELERMLSTSLVSKTGMIIFTIEVHGVLKRIDDKDAADLGIVSFDEVNKRLEKQMAREAEKGSGPLALP